MDSPEKLATHGTQDEEQQYKNTTQYVFGTTMRKTNTNNVNKTWALLQTTGGKEEPNIAFMRKHIQIIINWTQICQSTTHFYRNYDKQRWLSDLTWIVMY